ncbi:GATase domain-containing protein [Fusarium sp. Ph1]|nr:GATase domain-containing protein [Fusarium sp. Ph1]
MTRLHQILVPETEEPPNVIHEEYGTHGDLLVRFVFDDVKASPQVEIMKHQVLASHDYPPLSNISAIMITGSKYSAVENDPWVPSLLDYVKQAYQAEIPIAGFCYGHQIIARALGGQVTFSPEGYELGVQEVTPSSQGVHILGTETLVLPVAPNRACSFTNMPQKIPQEQGAISQELFDSQVKGGGQPKGVAVLSKLVREFLLGLD